MDVRLLALASIVDLDSVIVAPVQQRPEGRSPLATGTGNSL